MEQIIQSIVRLVDRLNPGNLPFRSENDRTRNSINLNGQMLYKPPGFYHDFQMQVLEKYKTLEPLETMDYPDRTGKYPKNLKSENDIYKFSTAA